MNSSNGNHIDGSKHNNQAEPIRILIVDDQSMIREGLKALIRTEKDFEVVGTAENGEDAIRQVEILEPDVVLMDMEMPGMDGVSATKIICEKFSNVKVLVLSTYDNQEYISRSLDSGAMGYLLKGTLAHELIGAIRSVYRGYAQIGFGAFQKIQTLTPKDERQDAPVQPALVTQAALDNSDGHQGTNGKLVSVPSINRSFAERGLATKNKSPLPQRKFEQNIVLRQSPKWSRAVVWAVVGVTTFAVVWSAVAKIEQVVPARGQLKPVGKVQEVQVPTNGVVKEVRVEEGERVKEGELLVNLDSSASKAQLKSLQNILQSLSQENQFYRTLMNGDVGTTKLEEASKQLDIPREIPLLARNRAELLAENQLFYAQLGLSQDNLSPEQISRLKATEAELQSRAASARLEVEQLEKQFNQNQVQLADTKAQLTTARQVVAEMEQRNREAIAQIEESLTIDREILSSLQPLVAEGALSRYQLNKQRQEVSDRYANLVEQRASGTIELDRQRQQVKTLIAEIERLQQEEKRLGLDIAQAKEQLINTTASSEKEIRDRIADNQKRIAEIDSQLNKSIVENDKRIAEINSQISSTEQTLRYQALYAPVSGTVFDLKAFPGYVPPVNQTTEPILKIVPDENLIAEVFITTQDIGFVEKGMITDVRIDTFPFSEFGDVEGEVISIGSDALEPDSTYDFFRFPARIKLEQQHINIRGKDIPLQSGMSISANIKVRENRTVLSLFTEKFFTGIDNFKQVR
ncbi:response regulator [Pleurocapsales cyanobacterium LEGE 06147]|nr:response regulator [Pleurocapsales cyanobacterium LEGE 06147]